jgi:hypothetical protein
MKINGNFTIRSAGTLEYNQSSPSGTSVLGYNGYFYATRVYNAVFNDYADFQPLTGKLEYGKCYVQGKEGLEISTTKGQKGVMGIATDTFGMSVGIEEGKPQVPIAVSGWVLAYVDGEYEAGTPLTCTEDGYLTEMTREDVREYPERIVAVYARPETTELWSSFNIAVDGRHWVKVK